MPRKTSAQVAAEREAQLKLDFENFVKSWPDRLMTALEAASNEDMTMMAMAGNFVVSFENEYGCFVEIRLPYLSSSWNDLHTLEELENELVRRKNEREEQARRESLISTALAKLTKEEREALRL